MKLCARVLLLFLVFKNVVCNEKSRAEDANTKSVYMPLIYLRNYTSSINNYTFDVPVIFIPVVIVPIDLNNNASETDDFSENTLEINNTTHKKAQSMPDLNNSESENDDIEVNFRQSLNRGAKVPKKTENKTDDDLKSNDSSDDNTMDSASNITNEVNISNHTENNKTEIQNPNESQTITNNNHLYPAPNYDNKLVDSLSLTTINEEIKLPDAEDKRWKNFIVSAKNSTNKTSTSNNLKSPKSEANRSKGPYSVALYNNAMIDQISITTNSYTNLESSTAPNDRWVTSPLGGPVLKPTGFKPLAGLYYDGFLHTPLIKIPGFNPHGDYYYP